LGYEVGTEITYVGERDEIAANHTITTSVALLGFVIVAMSMVGLTDAITTNVLERTREIASSAASAHAHARSPASLPSREPRLRSPYHLPPDGRLADDDLALEDEHGELAASRVEEFFGEREFTLCVPPFRRPARLGGSSH
jgi:hypothetical protein